MKTKCLLAVIILLAAALRFIGLDKIPPSLYSDEVSQGYNAYAILKTGRDEYGTYLPVSLRSFGDWKPPLPTYSMIPTIALLGLNAWGVRLPSAILGVFTIWVIYELIWEFLHIRKTKFSVSTSQKIALISALFFAISPWHILQSRAAMLIGPALFWLLLGILGFLKGLKKNQLWWYISAVGFIAAIYSYYGMRLIVPLLFLGLIKTFAKEIWQKRSKVLVPGIFAVLLLLPLFFAFIRESDVIFGRVKTVSIFYDAGVRLTVAELIAQDGVAAHPILVRIFHNKPIFYAMEIIRRFGQHLDGTFLFLKGDIYSPFQLPDVGLLYLTDAVFIVLGTIYLLRRHNHLVLFCFGWLIITILPAALTFVTPSSNRMFNSLVVFILLSAAGWVWFSLKYKSKILLVFVSLLLALQLGYFLRQYFMVLPLHHGNWWHYGNRELFSYLKSVEDKYEIINIYGDPTVIYIFKLFYEQTPPQVLADQLLRNFHPDVFGFEHVDAFGKYQFFRSFAWRVEGEKLLPGSLLAVPSSVEVGNEAKLIKQIYYPDGKPVYNFYEI